MSYGGYNINVTDITGSGEIITNKMSFSRVSDVVDFLLINVDQCRDLRERENYNIDIECTDDLYVWISMYMGMCADIYIGLEKIKERNCGDKVYEVMNIYKDNLDTGEREYRSIEFLEKNIIETR